MFIDKKKRLFVPYKGWCIDNMGEQVKDPLINICIPPLRIIDNIKKLYESNQIANNHILYNLLDKNGKEILPKWVRKITYIISYNIFIVEDNNEDEVVNKYGCINKEYWEKYNVIDTEGKFLTEEWFENITPSTGGYLHIERNGKYNLIDLQGHFLLKSDSDFVSDYFDGYAYCLRDGILLKVFSDGKEKLIKCLDAYNDNLFGELYSKQWHKYLKGIYRQNRDGNKEWNFLVYYKYVLFRRYYERLTASGIQGLFFACKNGEKKLIDMAEKFLTDYSFKFPYSSYFLFGYAIIEIEGKYGIINHLGKIIFKGFSSVLWAPQKDRSWMMIIFRNSTEKHFYHCQGGDYIHYAHDFLIRNQIVCLLEKDNIWYYPDYNNNIIELFECAPESIETYSDSY